MSTTIEGDRHAALLWLWPVAAALGLAIAILPPDTAVTLLAVLLAGGIALLWPLAGLGMALLAGPWGALEGARGGGLLDSGQLLILVTLVGWVAHSLRRRRLAIPASPLNIPFLLFLAIVAITLPDAPSLRAGLLEVIKWGEMLLVMWLVVDLAGNRPQGTRLAAGLLLMAGLSQALIGIWQFALRGHGPEHFLVLGRFYRAYGTFEQPNPFGGYMSMTAVLALGALVGLVAVAGRARWFRLETWARPWPFLVLATAVAATLAVLLSWSRGAWLGFAAAVGLMAFFLSPRRRLGIALVVIGALVTAALWQSGWVPASIAARLTGFVSDFQLGDVRGAGISPENYAVLERLAHWQAALDMARENPWLGVGFGNYEAAYPRYALLNWPLPLGHAHNYYLNLLGEVGLIGLLAYGMLWTAVIWQTIRLLQSRAWPERGLALGLLAVWTTLTVHHLVDKLYVNNLYITMGAMLGLLQLLAGASRAIPAAQDE